MIKKNGSGTNAAGIKSAISSNASTRTYFLEAAIPWTQLGITPADGTNVKMDVGVDVSKGANSSERIAQYVTYSNTDQAFNNSSGYGTVSMKICGDVTTDLEDASISKYEITAFNKQIKIANLQAGEIISVYNTLGVKLQTLIATEDVMYIDVENALYILSIGTDFTTK